MNHAGTVLTSLSHAEVEDVSTQVLLRWAVMERCFCHQFCSAPPNSALLDQPGRCPSELNGAYSTGPCWWSCFCLRFLLRWAMLRCCFCLNFLHRWAMLRWCFCIQICSVGPCWGGASTISFCSVGPCQGNGFLLLVGPVLCVWVSWRSSASRDNTAA